MLKPPDKPNPAAITIPTNTRPPEDLQRTSYRILRAPAQGELTGLCLSAEIHGVMTHYHLGRTRPHTEPCCQPCEEGQAPRWQGYLALLLTRSRDLCLLEFTAAPTAPLLEYVDHHGTLRGAQLTCYRMGNRSNGRVCIRVARGDLDMFAAPPAPDVPAILARIWQVDRLIAAETARALEHNQAARIVARGDSSYTADHKQPKP
jgi:hypothetical protein